MLQFTEDSTQNLFIEILSILPNHQKRVLISKIESWDVDENSYIINQIQILLKSLLQQNDSYGLDLYLTKFLLKPVEDIKSNYRVFDTILDNWHYQQFFKDNKEILIGKDWYTLLLVELIEEFNKIEQKKGISYFTSNFRTNLLRPERHLRDEAFQIVVKNFLDVLDREYSLNEFKNIWIQLQRYPSHIFTRIKIILISRQSEVPQEFIDEILLDRFSFENFPEYRYAVQKHFEKLSLDHKRVIWDWITNPMPSTTFNGSDDEEYKTRRIERDLWRKLERIQPHLSVELNKKWEILKVEYGDKEESGSSIRFKEGTSSSIRLEDLNKRTIPEVITLLQGEAPSTGDEWFDRPESRIEGLADVVRQDANLRPEEYFRHPELLKSIPPIYLNHIIDGYRSREADIYISLRSYIDVLNYVCYRSQEAASEKNWSFCVGSMCDNLEKMVQDNSSLLKSTYDGREISEALTKALLDPDPPADLKVENLKNYGDAYTRSLNVTRGKALHALVRLMGVMQSNSNVDEEESHYGNIEYIQASILQHLELREQSGSVFSAIIPTLPWLNYHYPEYAAKIASLCFDRRISWRSSPVWNTHLKWNRFYSQIFQLINGSYADYAREDLNSNFPVWEIDNQTQQDFAEHVGIFYIRGLIRFGMEEGILENFLSKASADAVANLFISTSQALERTEGDVDEYVNRLKLLWSTASKIFIEYRSTEEQGKLYSSFTWIIKNNYIDIDWRLNELKIISNHPRDAKSDFLLLKNLTEIKENNQQDILEIVELLSDTQPISGIAVRQVKDFLESLKHDKNPLVTEKVNNLVNLYVSLGYIGDFRPLYREVL